MADLTHTITVEFVRSGKSFRFNIHGKTGGHVIGRYKEWAHSLKLQRSEFRKAELKSIYAKGLTPVSYDGLV